MSTEQQKDLIINGRDESKRMVYLAKEFLLTADHIDLVSGTTGAPVAARTAETLKRLGYITYDNVFTEAQVHEGRIRTRFVIRIRKTNEFKKLYEENVENRKRVIAEREEQQGTPSGNTTQQRPQTTQPQKK